MKKAYKIFVPLSLGASIMGGIILIASDWPLVGIWVLVTSLAGTITWLAKD